MTFFIDINADVGEALGDETFDPDNMIMPYITSANIACGLHAGNPFIINKTVSLALKQGVGIGAHPGLPDRAGFGRRAFEVLPEEVYKYVKDQLEILRIETDIQGAQIQHLKPHGALYNMAATDHELARTIVDVIVDLDPNIILIALANSEMVKAGEDAGLQVAQEAFIDREYLVNGTLVPRDIEGAVITDVDRCVSRALDIVKNGKIETFSGDELTINPHTICIHGDTPHAEIIARKVREAIEAEGVIIASLPEVLASRINRVKRYVALGDAAVIAEFGNEISPEINDAVLGFQSALHARGIPGVLESYSSYCALTIQYDPQIITYDDLVARLPEAEKKERETSRNVQVFEIPVCYGGEYGPDIEHVAQANGLSVSEVIDIHSSGLYPLYMLGFMPGFAYLGGLDQRLHTPRLESPRLRVDAGSVGIAGAQTGIYAIESPGGWQIIGRTPKTLVDFSAEKPVLYEPGDSIRFIPISPKDFRSASHVD